MITIKVFFYYLGNGYLVLLPNTFTCLWNKHGIL